MVFQVLSGGDNFRTFPFNKNAAEDLAGRRFGNLVNEFQVTESLVWSDPLSDKPHNLFGCRFLTQDDYRLWHFSGLIVSAT